MVGNVDEWEFLLFRLLGNHAQLYFEAFDLFDEFLMGFVMSKHLSCFFMSPEIMFFILFLQLHQAVQFVFLHFAFHFFSPRNRLLQFFRHSMLDLFLSLDLLLRYFDNRVKINLNALNKIKLFMNLLVELMSSILVNWTNCWLVLFGKVTQLLLVI